MTLSQMKMPINIIVGLVFACRVDILLNKIHKHLRDISNLRHADKVQAAICEPVALNQYAGLLALFLQKGVAQAAVD